MDLQRRFGGLDRLYGDQAVLKLASLHVIVAGIGGVGSWCAEALARSGVGYITLVDLDHIAESNINRQIHALSSTLGKSKVLAMADRISEINPACNVHCVDDFIDPENTADVINDSMAGLADNIHTVLIDCTDQVPAKIAMILHAKSAGLEILVCGGAGGKTDPFSMRAGDIAVATHDALLGRIRNVLRRKHGYPRANNVNTNKARRNYKKTAPKMGIWAIWFEQETILPDLWQPAYDTVGATDSGQQTAPIKNVPSDPRAPQGLSCAGYGSSVTITASMGLAVASQAIKLHLAN